jgi:hypothetical protein
MPEADAHVGVALEDELAAMSRSVVSSAQGNDISELVAPAFGAQLDVMQIEKRCTSATGHPAAVLVAQQHGSA